MGTTVGSILISYDVDDKNPEVKEALLQLGYEDSWKYDIAPRIFDLPDTTLWHSNKTTNQGLKDMEDVCFELGVTLEKAVAVLADEFVGI